LKNMAVRRVEVILDTNIILRYLLRDLEDQYDIVRERLKRIQKVNGVVLVFGEVVAECIYIMEKLYKMTRTEMVSVLEPFLQTEVVVLEDKSVVLMALKMYEFTRLSYVDCLIIEKGRESGTEILTFDRKLFSKLNDPTKPGGKNEIASV